jgi:hypothetical protein
VVVEKEVVTGGADSVLNVWHDATEEEEAKQQAAEEQLLLAQQELLNRMAARDYKRTVELCVRYSWLLSRHRCDCGCRRFCAHLSRVFIARVRDAASRFVGVALCRLEQPSRLRLVLTELLDFGPLPVGAVDQAAEMVAETRELAGGHGLHTTLSLQAMLCRGAIACRSCRTCLCLCVCRCPARPRVLRCQRRRKAWRGMRRRRRRYLQLATRASPTDVLASRASSASSRRCRWSCWTSCCATCATGTHSRSTISWRSGCARVQRCVVAFHPLTVDTCRSFCGASCCSASSRRCRLRRCARAPARGT